MIQRIKNIIAKLWKSKLFKTFFILTIIYKLIFNVFTAQFAIDSIFPSLSTGKLSVNVKRFSLFYGVILENIKLNSGNDFENKEIFAANRLALTYNIPLLFLGRLKISEVSLINPNINLWQKSGKWNYETIMKPSEAKEEKKEEEKEEKKDSEPSGELNLFIPVSAYAYINLENVNFKMVSEPGEKFSHTELKNFNFKFLLDTNRFRKIPYTVKAIDILKILKIEINPQNQISILAKDNNSELKTDLNLKLVLFKDSTKNPSEFLLDINIGNKSIPIILKNSPKVTFGLELFSNIILIPEADKVDIKTISLNFSGKEWLDIRGSITKLTTDKPYIDIKVSESEIQLQPLSKTLESLPFRLGMLLSGRISLEGINAKGDIDNLFVGGKIRGDSLLVSMKENKHSIPIFDFHFDSHLNLSDKASSTENDILPILERAKVHTLKTEYNGIKLDLSGEVIPKSLVDLDLSIKNVRIHQFTNAASGTSGLDVKVTGDKLSYLNLDAKAVLHSLQYKMGRGRSGRQKVILSLKTVIDLAGGFKFEDLQIEPFNLKLYNEFDKDAVNLSGNIDLDMKTGLKVELKNLNIITNMTGLIPTLPLSLKPTISGIRNGLGNKLTLGGNAVYSSSKEKDSITLGLNGKFPAIELNDLHLAADVHLWKDKAATIQINKLHLDAFKNQLKANYSGKFYKPFTANPPFGDLTGELKGNFTLESTTLEKVLKGIYFKGDIDFDLDMKGALVQGKLHSKDSYVKYVNQKNESQYYEINGITLDIPFAHDIKDTTTERLTTGNKENLIQNYGQTLPPNFIINTVKGSHPGFTGQEFTYLAPKDGYPGFSARLDYEENVLRIDNIRIFALNGLIFGKDIIFNVGNGNSKEMEYSAVLQIRDVDLKELLKEDVKDKIDDGKIKADLNIKGRDLTDPVGNMDLFFSIFQIGEDFGKSAINIVSPTNLITDAIIGSYSVNKIEVELSKGLVYAKIKFNESLLNRVLFKIEDNQIKQERIPIASFLNRTKDELSNYK
ncbi:MAG: hypothetical protein KDK36_03225 [Leptospiraceae bacterium]|nr:hypothetical protein [Leptospiraceae bacterium]